MTTEHAPAPAVRPVAPTEGYAGDDNWEAIARAVPEQFRPGVGPDSVPREEWWSWTRGTEGGTSTGSPGVRADIHLDRYGPADAPATLVVLHGGGGNGRLVGSMGVMAARAGFAAVAPDLPGYGLTRVSDRRAIRYPDWVECAAGLVRAEAERGPVVVAGLSMGGWLAFDAVAAAGVDAPIIASCLLHTPDPIVRRGISRPAWLGSVAPTLLHALRRVTDRMLFPVAALTDMTSIVNDRSQARLISRDRRSGGIWMPLGFFRTYLSHEPMIQPEAYRGRLVLAHPAADPWTPIELSLRFLHRVPAAHREVVLLERAGHWPVERPGIDQLADVIAGELTTATTG